MVQMILQIGFITIKNQMIGDNVTKKKESEYAESREEYFREFHSVVAPVVVIDGYEYKRKYDDELSFCLHTDE